MKDKIKKEIKTVNDYFNKVNFLLESLSSEKTDEKSIIHIVDCLCVQSLETETHDLWKKVKDQLFKNRNIK